MVTTHTFTNLGFRTMPIGSKGYKLCRDEKGKKQILNADNQVIEFKTAMPPNWTMQYGKQRQAHADTALGGLICGALDKKQADEVEILAIDCDNQAAWDLVRALDPSYLFHFESVGKPGGTVVYELPEELRDVPQFSINNGDIALEYMAKRKSNINAMVYLPTSSNLTKKQIAKGAELTQPPAMVISLLKSLEPKEVAAPTVIQDVTSTLLPFNAPLVKQYVLEAKAASDGQGYGILARDLKLGEKVYKIFTPKKFRDTLAYKTRGWIHPNNLELLELGSYSEYIVGVSSIAGADPSIDVELYIEFMQAVNAQLDDPFPADRYLAEVLNPMTAGRAKINGKPIWRYNENWDQDSHTLVNQYGDQLEYFAHEEAPNEFIEFNHTSATVLKVSSISALLDRVYTMDSAPGTDKPSRSIVKKLKLVREENSVRSTPGIFVNKEGRTIINTEKPTMPLRILRNPELYPAVVDSSNLYAQAFDVFITHLLEGDKDSINFMRQLLAYHGRHLESIPVIIYMVGVGGAGKSQFAYILEMLFGSNTTRRPSAQQLTSRFNDFLENCAILVLSETSDTSYAAQDGIKAVLKTVTGERSIDIETKGRPLKPNVPMFALPVLLANEPWYREDTADRRLFSLMPSQTLLTSKPVVEFEAQHGVRVVECIVEGIRNGAVPKYLSQFCPERLPPVPFTKFKQDMTDVQDDPVSLVKSLLVNEQHDKLFDLLETHKIEDFFYLMNSDCAPLLKRYYYSEHLIELVKEMREGGVYPSDKEIRKTFTGTRLLEIKSRYSRNTRGAGPNSYKKVGLHRWEYLELPETYEAWTLASLSEED